MERVALRADIGDGLLFIRPMIGPESRASRLAVTSLECVAQLANCRSAVPSIHEPVMVVEKHPLLSTLTSVVYVLALFRR